MSFYLNLVIYILCRKKKLPGDSGTELFKKKLVECFALNRSSEIKDFLTSLEKLYLTLIDKEFKGDTFFPEVEWDEWERVSEENGMRDESNPYKYKFVVYERNILTKV